VSGQQDPLDQIRARRAAITPPPWFYQPRTADMPMQFGRITSAPGDWHDWQHDDPRWQQIVEVVGGGSEHPTEASITYENAEFIAHAPTDIDHLLAEVERLKNMLADCRKHRDKRE
jgi:hypothetical protein